VQPHYLINKYLSESMRIQCLFAGVPVSSFGEMVDESDSAVVSGGRFWEIDNKIDSNPLPLSLGNREGLQEPQWQS
jgi:hypothetical protein